LTQSVFGPGTAGLGTGTVNPGGGNLTQDPGPNDAFLTGTPLPHGAFIPGSYADQAVPAGSVSGGDFSGGGTGVGPDGGTSPAATDPNASFSFDDPNAGGGAGTSGLTPSQAAAGIDPYSGQSLGAPNAFGVQAQSGSGQPVQVNLGPGTAKDLQSFITAPIQAAENWASTQFAQLSNWFTRGFLLVLAIVVMLVALWRVSGSPSPAQVIAKA
jgi:hypothetical protein